MSDLSKKLQNLREILKSYGKLAVAFSSGVDSTFLLKMAKETLGDNVLALTAVSSFMPQRESDETIQFCEEEGINHIRVNIDPLSVEGIKENPKNRCYLCKKEIFGRLKEAAKKEGFLILAEGSNMDDNGDYRPGMMAIRELGIESPLRKSELYKEEIRILSRELNLKTFSKPSYACLASRFPYGEELTKEKLFMVEQAEELLMSLGFLQMRVRIHGTLARIEVESSEFEKLMKYEIRYEITKKLKSYGFSYVTLDLQGFRSGSMNEALSKAELNKWKDQ